MAASDVHGVRLWSTRGWRWRNLGERGRADYYHPNRVWLVRSGLTA
jgi:hypothetical protein